ncbi:MAG: MFS transporter [Acetobacteraceae bacterium]|nr:MFS transporter [Acetobacteraceae bacterium]
MTADPGTAAPRTDPRLIAAIVASALFMQNLDSAAVFTALPAMARDLGEPPARMGAAVTAYLVALTVFIPASAWLGDRVGAKRLFLAALALFAAASAACAMAGGLGWLVGARFVQGMAGAMMLPVARLLVLRQARKDEIIRAMTWLTMPALLGPIAGPPVGGLLTDVFGWRAVFLVNLPVAALGILLAVWKVPPIPARDPGAPDVLGLVLVGLALGLSMFGLETIGRGVVPSPLPLLGLAAGGVFAALAVRHCLSAPRPALDLSLLRVPSYFHSAVPATLFRVGAGASPFLVPTVLQIGLGHGATEAGFLSFATALGAFGMKPLVRPLLGRFGFRSVIVAGALLAGASIAACALIGPGWPWFAVFLLLAAGGLVRSLLFTSLGVLSVADLPPERLAAATALSQTLQQFSPALGVVLATATLEASAALSGRAGAALAPEDFAAAFVVAGIVAASAAPIFARMPADAGADVGGRRPRA